MVKGRKWKRQSLSCWGLCSLYNLGTELSPNTPEWNDLELNLPLLSTKAAEAAQRVSTLVLEVSDFQYGL